MSVISYRPVPAQLTNPLPKPAPPPRRCLLKGKPAVCASDAIALLPIYDALIDIANGDRRKAALLGGSVGQ